METAMASAGERAPPRDTITRLLPFCLLLAGGCTSDLPDDARATPPPAIGTAFDLAKTGRVAGRATWNGTIPDPPGFLYGVPRPDGLGFAFRTAENPNRPHVDPTTRALADAVVFLRGIDPAAGRPWDLPPVRVEMGDARITVVQGEHRGRVGFVQRGGEVAVMSREAVYHVLRGRGDAFFSLTLPEPNKPVSRTLAAPGRVELSSGTGMYWASADLLVTEHPYYTLTDADGHFAFDRVPAGPVEVVVWVPGWTPVRQERDPDSTAVTRQNYGPPLERAATVTVAPDHPAEVNLRLP
jgi:hypothetical protein